MTEPTSASWLPSTLAVAGTGLASLAAPPALAAAITLAVALWLLRRRCPLPARGRRGVTALGALALLALATAAIGGLGRASAGPRATRELDESHGGLWREIEASAERAASSLSLLSSGESGRGERFAGLRAVAGANASVNLLLWDRFGDLEAWWGPGPLPDLDAAARRQRERRVVQSALSSTLYVTRRFRDATGESWTLAVAESFPHDGPPPTRQSDRARWRGVPWRLVPVADAAPPRWELRADLRGRTWNAVPWLRGFAAAAAGLVLAGIAFAGAGLGVASSARQGNRPGAATSIFAGVAGAALVAAGCGASRESLLALVAGCSLLALAAIATRGVPAEWRWGRPLALALAAGAGPALLGAASAFAPRARLVEELSLLSPSAAAVRVGAVAAVLAAWALAARLGASRPLRAAGPPPFAALAAVVPATLAAFLADFAEPAAVALALAGAGAAAVLLVGRAGGRVGLLGIVFAASLVAAAGWSAGERQAEMRRMGRALSRLLPPSVERMAELASEIERDLAALDPAELLPPLPGDAVPEDLAFALWRGSALARHDVLSSLSIAAPDGTRSLFSSGLPIAADGTLDLSPARWVGLAPGEWLERRTGGERMRRDGTGREWVIRWLAVPLPGFGASTPPAAAGETAFRRFREQVSANDVEALHAVLYEGSGRIARSPWPEGTPAFDPRWTDSPPFSRYRATPDGPARVAAASGSGCAAAIFLPLTKPLVALERAGTFLAGAWLPCLALALAIGLAATPWRGIGRELAHAWRSYSTRLVLVFSLFLLLPIAAGSTWVAHAYALRLERQQELSALDALHSAQRILGEYVLSLEPGFGVGTAVDDRLLEWLARVVRSEVHLYWGSELYASSHRHLFAAGLLPARLAGEIWQRIHIEGERVVRSAPREAARAAVEIYAPLEIPGIAPEATKLVLALPRLAQQDELAAEVAGIRRRAFLAAAALAVLLALSGSMLARRFARPIEAIVRGTQRIAEGAPSLGYEPDEVELEALAGAIDRMAAKVSESRERLLVEKRLVERIAENVTAAVIALDGGGRVVFANRLARDRVHAVPGELLLERLRAAGLDGVAQAFLGAERASGPTSTRMDLGGGERDLTLVRAALPGPGEPSELVVIEDVTDVVRAQRLDAWAGMARIIAHEVKNPLTPIRLSTEHLREAWARDREHFAAVFERCTENILRQVEELRQTASEFSLYSEIPRIDRRADDLREAIGEIVEAYRAAPPAGIEIVFDGSGERVPAVFDRRLLGRAVRNLIENAVRASASAGRVEVVIEPRPGEVAIHVLDEGPGVAPEMVPRVVEPYFSTRSGGTGLGLPIARRVVEEHGGTLTLRNRPSGGFEVTITIPRS